MTDITNDMVVARDIFRSYGLTAEAFPVDKVIVEVNTFADGDCYKLARCEVQQMGLKANIIRTSRN